MKKISQRILAIALAAGMCLTTAACNNNEKDASQSPSATPSASPSTSASASPSASGELLTGPEKYKDADEIEISVAMWGWTTDKADGEDAIRDKIYDDFKIKFKFYGVTWDDYKEKAQMWAATNDLPDITAVDVAFTDTFDSWVKDGIVSQIPDDLSAYPTLAQSLSFPDAQKYKKDGHFYGIPRPNYKSPDVGILDPGIMIRKDWMAKVGVTKLPENTEEFIDLLKKFQTEDPDGNGKADTVGLSAYNIGWLSVLNLSTEPGAVNGYDWIDDKDNPGKWIPSFLSKDFLPAMKEMRKYFDAGVVSPDIAIFKDEMGRDKFKNSQAGAYAHSNDTSGFGNMQEDFKKLMPNTNFEDIVAWIPPFKHYTDNCYYYKNASLYWSETYLKAGMDENKMDRILGLMDYLLSDEGWETYSFGFEGEDYTKDSAGNIVLNDKIYKKDGTEAKSLAEKYPMLGICGLTNWSSYHMLENPATKPETKNLVESLLEWGETNGAKAYPSHQSDVEGMDYPSKAKATATANFSKDLNTLMTAPDLEAAVKKLQDDYLKNGYEDIIKEINEIAETKGLK
jgi:putative aldouronate transport system substrate-binding protein